VPFSVHKPSEPKEAIVVTIKSQDAAKRDGSCAPATSPSTLARFLKMIDGEFPARPHIWGGILPR
jgi:hypothetical protein